MEPRLLVIDTDGGGDDAAAILLALSNKEVGRVLAVTCCFGNTNLDNVCSNVLRLLTLCKETEIPVYRGCREPLIANRVEYHVFGTDGFGNVSHQYPTGALEVEDTPAPFALIELAKKYHGMVDLVAIGPLTNLAIAHRIDPQFTTYLRSLTCMGGNFKSVGNITEVAEFNFYCDPEAAHIVLSEARCPTMLIPWEPVPEFGITWEFYEQMKALPSYKAQFVKRINESYVDRAQKKGNKRYCDGDFIAMAALLYPECISESIEREIRVECSGAYTRGLMILLRDMQQPYSDSSVSRSGEISAISHGKIKIITSFQEEILNNLRLQMLA